MALATLITTAVVALGVIMPRVLKRLEVSYRVAFIQTWMPALAPAIPSGIAVHLLSSTGFAGEIPTLLISSTLGGLVYGVCYLSIPGTATRASARRSSNGRSAAPSNGPRPASSSRSVR